MPNVAERAVELTDIIGGCIHSGTPVRDAAHVRVGCDEGEIHLQYRVAEPKGELALSGLPRAHHKLSRIEGNAFFAICDAVSGAVVGMAAYWDSQPVFGVTELAAVWFAPAFQRTLGATDAMFLMLTYAMDELGYRRVQWRCNAMNAKSRSAAKRLGFRFEGIFFGNMVSKGRNRDTAWYSILDSEWPGLKPTIEAWLDPSNFDVEGKQLQSLSVMTAAR